MRIYVGNLPYEVTDEQLRTHFETHGEVSSVDVLIDRYTGRPRGFGFVEMPDSSQAETAVRELDGKEYMGRVLKVNEARPRRQDDRDRGGSGGGGGFGGGGGGFGGGGGGGGRYDRQRF